MRMTTPYYMRVFGLGLVCACKRLRTTALAVLCGAGALPAPAQTWIEQGPAPTTGGQTVGMAAQGSPVYGAVERIAVHPTNPDVMLIGAVNGGVWRTTNATAASPNWTPVTDFLPSLSIGGLAYDKNNPNIVYAGMGKYSALSSWGGARAGLFKSSDGGLTWAAVAGNSSLATPGVNISGVVANGNNILVSTDAADNDSYDYIGLWRSTDGGASFTKLGSEAGLDSRKATAIVADPTNANRYYLAVHNADTTSDEGVYRSNDGGATWTQLHDAALDALMTTTTSNMKLSINNNGALFVAVANSGRCSGVFRTTDQGETFTSFGIPTTTDGPATNTVVNGIHPGSQAGCHFSLLADPTNNDVVYIGGDRQPLGKEVNGVSAVGATQYSGRLFRSSGAGSWTAVTDNQTVGGSGPHADSRVMVFDLSGNIVEGDDGGLYRLSSPGTTNRNWTAVGSSGASGLRVMEVHSIAYDSHGGVLIAGTQDNGTPMQTVHNGTTWTSVSVGDGGVVGVYDRPGTISYRYSSYYELRDFRYVSFDSSGAQVGGTNRPDLIVTGSGGKDITQFEPSAFPGDEGSKAYVPDGTTTPPGVPFYTKFAVNKVDAGRLVFGTKSLYETADHGDALEVLGGITSTNTPAIRFSDEVAALAYGGFKGTNAYADVLYSGAGTELRIRPAGAGFNVLPGIDAAYTTAAGSTNFSITDIVLDYTDWDHAFVANSAGRVFYSLDGGVSWTEIPNLSTAIGGELLTLEYIENGSIEAVFAGGLNGVFWAVETNGIFGAWSEFGASSLPNAKITDLDYNRYADVLSVGTLGRGIWTIENASQFLVPEPGSAVLLALGLGGLLMRRRRRSSAVLCLLAATLLAAPVARAIEIADDFTYAGTNGFAASRTLALNYLDYPVFAAVGVLEIGMGASEYLGTGTLLNNEWVLTAAHNWVSTEVTSLDFCLGGSTYSAVMSSLVQHPLWTRAGPSQGWDVALFRLSTPITNSIVYPQLYTGTDELGKTGFTLGAGRLGTGTVPWYEQTNSAPLVYAAANVIDRTTAQTSSAGGTNYTGGLFVNDFDGTISGQNTLGISYNTNTPVNPWVWGTSNYIVTTLDSAGIIVGTNSSAEKTTGTGGNVLEGATAPGDSGGPTFLFDEQAQSWKLAGITSWGQNPWDSSQSGESFRGLYGDVNYFTRVSQSSTWITSQIPEPSTCGLLALGLGGLLMRRRRRGSVSAEREDMSSARFSSRKQGRLWVAFVLAAIVGIQTGQADITFMFDFDDPDEIGWYNPTEGKSRRTALITAAESLGKMFDAKGTIGYTVKCSNNPQSATLASASSESYGPASAGFELTVVQYKIQSNYNGRVSYKDGSINWNFGKVWGYSEIAANVGTNEMDFKSTAMHELLHSFGFISAIGKDGTGILPGKSAGEPDLWYLCDKYLKTSNGVSLINPTTFELNTDLLSSLTGGVGAVRFSGSNAVLAYSGGVPTYSPTNWQSGSSFGHTDDLTFTNALALMMNAESGDGPGIRTLSSYEKAILKDIGYVVATNAPSTGIDGGQTRTISGSAANLAANALVGSYSLPGAVMSANGGAMDVNIVGDYIIGSNSPFNGLIITNAGVVNVSGDNVIGNSVISSNNYVVVTGAGSIWSAGGGVYVGATGSFNQLTVASGGQVLNTDGYIGDDIDAGNNAVLVAGIGSVWTNSGNLFVGYWGSGNSLTVTNGGTVFVDAELYVGLLGSSNAMTIADGGRVFNSFGYIGCDGALDGGNNSALVIGSGSLWSNSNDVILGGVNNAIGNSLTIANGGQVLGVGGVIGYDNGASNNTVLVAGSGSVWNNSGSVYAGYNGSQNGLIITNGGVVLSAGGSIGYGADNAANSNSMLVTGAGSAWNNNGDLYVGTTGAFNRLTVANGGQVFNGAGYIGYDSNSINNSVIVSGSGSIWSNSGTLLVGRFSSSNSLNISSGGAVAATNIVVGAGASSGNRISVSGGSLYATNAAGTGALNVNYGTLALNGGTVVANQLVATNGGNSAVSFSAGLLRSGYSTVSNGTAFVVGDGVQSASYDMLGGTHSFASGLSISTNGNLIGNGDIIGSVTNFGIIAPGHSVGLVGISGDLMLMESSILMMEIGGVSTNDHLDVSGLLQAGGWLNVTFTGGYTGNAGDSFDLFDFGSVNGMFSQTNLPTLGAGKEWETSGLYTSGTVSIVPEPGSAALLALGLGGIATRRRRG